MYLKSLLLNQFKNYENAALEFDSNLNCFTGDNAAGKTNLLDAIYYLSIGKSYFNSVDQQLIFHDQIFFTAEGIFSDNDHDELIKCIFQKGKKKELFRNKVKYDRLSDHVGLIPVVIITPDDIDLIHGGSEGRRKFLDNTLSQVDHSYLENLLHYTRVLSQRNAALKNFAESGKIDQALIQVYDQELIVYAESIYSSRLKMIEQFIPVFQKHYSWICHEKEKVSCHFQSDLSKRNFGALLQKNFQRDCILQRTSSGIHQDDLVFEIDGYPVKKFGSQGQQKSFLIALKLAQYEFLSRNKNLKPILLLDDMFDKLDHHRVSQLMELISGEEIGQAFITDTNPDRIQELLQKVNRQAKIFRIDQGKISIA